jgi:hypothetical protein
VLVKGLKHGTTYQYKVTKAVGFSADALSLLCFVMLKKGSVDQTLS